MIAAARQAAFAALIAHEATGVALPAAIARARGSLTDDRDQALLTELVTGVVRMRLALDYQVERRSGRRVATLDAEVRTSLRLGAFQLLYLDRLPASAVVNDAVALTKRSGKTSASGLVNAVLRRLAGDRHRLEWPEAPPSLGLATRHSHPEWLVSRWLARYGQDVTARWLAFDNDAPRLCLATNRVRISRAELAERLSAEGVRTTPTTHAPHGLHVDSGPALSTEAFREGWFVVQDEASQLIAELGPLEPGQRVLDLCASPGGKTMALAARVGSGTRVVACDVRPRRTRILKQTLSRLRLDVPVAQVPPAGDLPFADGAFDFVLVDAPCSGLGTVRRDPDIRWARTEADLGRLARAQQDLLQRASRVVAPGGTLVYATCSSEPEENDDVAAAFLGNRDDFTLGRVHRTLPVPDGLEAFYGAVLRRNV